MQEDLRPLEAILGLAAGHTGGARLRLEDRGGVWFDMVRGTVGEAPSESRITLEGTDLVGTLAIGGPQAGGVLADSAALIHDILKLRRLGSERRRQPRGPEGASFMPGVVHELRNFLFAMSAGLDAFEIRFGEGDAAAGHAASLRLNLNRLQGFLQELDAYGNPATLTFSRGPLRPVLAQGLRLAGSLGADRRVRLVFHDEAPEVEERMDRGALEAAFRHLLEVVVLETAEGGEVGLAARLLEGRGRPWVEVELRGTPGRGRVLDPNRLFEPFHYRDKALPRLGLAIARRTLEAHGGQVVAVLETGGLRVRGLLPVWLPGQTEANP